MASPEALLAVASGVALAGLGVFLLALRPRRRESVVFGAFALLWAAQVLTANLARITGGGAAVHGPALVASFAVMAPATLLLAHVAAGHLGGRAGAALRVAGIAVALAAGLVLALAPRLVVERVTAAEATPFVTVLGPLAFPLLLAPFHLAFVAACLAAYVRWRSAAPGSPRDRARDIFCAFAFFAAYVTVRNLALVLRLPPDLLLAGGQTLASAATYALGAVALLAVLAHGARRLDRWMWLAVLVPAGMAAAEALLWPQSVLGTGLWRLACVAVVAYALARHQLFDFELRLKESAAALLAAVALGLGILGTVATSGLGPLLAGLAAAGGSLALREHVGRVLFPAAQRSPSYVRARQLDVYRVRLEESIARPGEGDEEDLRRLRRALHVTDPEHVAMEVVLRAHHRKPGARVSDRYRLLRVLGEGGFGRAHLAQDEHTGSLVVVKLLHGGDAAREAGLARRIDSPHVVRVLDEGESAGAGFLAMEYVEGGTLADRLARETRLPPAEVLRLAEGLLGGLAAAHRAGVVHGDVKPDNVLLGADGAPRLADFGAGRALDAERTRDAAGQASLHYASPEQLRGEPATPRSDVYAAAAVLRRCLAGRPRAAWDDDEDEALAEAPPRLRAVLARALARDPAARYADAGEMLDALRGVSATVVAPG